MGPKISFLIDLQLAGLSKVFTLLLCLFFIGCQKTANTKTRIDIQIPDLQRLQSMQKSGVSAQSTFPSTGTLCFVANVTGDGIPSFSNACSVQVGIASQFATPGNSLSVEVPTGANRNIAIYLYHLAAGSACPQMNSQGNYPAIDSKKLYLVGNASGLKFENEVENVSINIAYPGATNTVAASFGGSCNSGSTPVASAPRSELGAISGVSTGSTVKVKYKINPSTESKLLTGSTLKIKTF